MNNTEIRLDILDHYCGHFFELEQDRDLVFMPYALAPEDYTEPRLVDF